MVHVVVDQIWITTAVDQRRSPRVRRENACRTQNSPVSYLPESVSLSQVHPAGKLSLTKSDRRRVWARKPLADELEPCIKKEPSP